MTTSKNGAIRHVALSDTCVRVLRAVADPERAPGDRAPLLAAAGGDKSRLVSSLRVLRDRWLITVETYNVRPRVRGLSILRQAAYRDKGRD